MFRYLVRSFCKNSSGLVIVAGAIAVLAGVEQLLAAVAPSQPPLRRSRPANSRAKSLSRSRRSPGKPACCFKIRQTRCEVGYVYWVLQGFGKHKCYVLHDTWREAMDEADARMKAAALGREFVPALAQAAIA